MEPGYGIGFLVAIVICGILTFLAFHEKRSIEKKIQSILNEMPEEIYYQLENANYEVCSDNANFMYGSSYIYEIIQKEGGVSVGVVYNRPTQNAKTLPNTLDYVFLSQEEYESNQNIVKEGVLVKTFHNRTNMAYKICRIELSR